MPGSTPTLAQVNAAIASFDWTGWNEKLKALYAPWYQATVNAGGEAAADAFALAWKPNDPGVLAFGVHYVGQRVTQIDDETRARLADTVEDYFEDLAEGEPATVAGLAGTLRDLFDDFAGSRANTIARTETAYAVNHGSAFTYRQGGYNYVEIADGDGDEECAAADGQIWSIEYFLANALEHPNCERTASPISDEDVKAAGGADEGDDDDEDDDAEADPADAEE